MDGGHGHKFLDSRIGDFCQKNSIKFTRQLPVRKNNKVIGFIDIAIFHNSQICGIEIERDNRRIEQDLEKSVQADLTELLIVVPNPKVKRAVKRRLNQLTLPSEPRIYFYLLYEALDHLKTFFLL